MSMSRRFHFLHHHHHLTTAARSLSSATAAASTVDPFLAHPSHHHLFGIKSKDQLLKSYTVTPPIKPWPQKLYPKRLVSIITSQQNLDLALQIFDHAGKFHPNFQHNYDTYHAIINKLARARAFEPMETLLAQLQQSDIKCGENLFIVVIRNYGIASRPKQALQTFLRIKDFGVETSSSDLGLRRMVYLMIKELSPSADEVIHTFPLFCLLMTPFPEWRERHVTFYGASKVIIVTSPLMKDMNSKTDIYQANAIRVLCRITDGKLLKQIERYLKQALVDKNPVVASAALVSGIHLLQTNPEIVKRWSNEVQEAIQSRAALVQFHALALLHQIRQNDRLAVSKLATSLTRGTVRSPLAKCLLIRYTSQVIRDSSMNHQTGDRPFYDYLDGCLHHKAEMVIFEELGLSQS